METCYIIVSAVLLLQVRDSLQNCVIIKPGKGPSKYWCKTIQELEREKSQVLDVNNVNIYNGKTFPVASNQTHTRTPSLQAVLMDSGTDGLSANTYQILKTLTNVMGSNKQLKTVTKGLFENLPLQKLHLNDKGIESIQVGAFSNMPHLQQLYITYNNLRTIETGIFNSLAVDTLSLSNNKISVIRKNALYNMKNLKHLHLDGNSLSEFRPELFLSYGSNLKTLLLQNNYLTELDRSTVKTLDNLKILNLAGNTISKIVIYSFENLLNLEVLSLANNRLLDLDADIFAVDGMPSLAKLEINDNKFSYLTPKVLGRLPQLAYIRIGGNPWTCPCFDAISKWLSDHGIQQFCDYDYYTGTRPVCVVPDVRSTKCEYTITNLQFINKYAEINSRAKDAQMCSI